MSGTGIADIDISVVVPCYRSEGCVDALAERVGEALAGSGERFELILVNDCSPDGTWNAIERAIASHDFVVGVDLRINVGQDNAIMAGLNQSRGEICVIMDDDLQHDPSDIPRLCAAIRSGHDVAYANFEQKFQAWWKNLGSYASDRLAVLLLGKPQEIYMSPFKAINRAVVDEVTRYSGPFSYVDGILFSVTSNMTQISATHHTRFTGQSNYDLIRSANVALKLATSFSVTPLRVASLVGAVIALLSFALGIYFIIEAIFLDHSVKGWPSLMVSIFFLGGIQLIGIGALGEYIGRIFITLNRRPQFVVREVSRHEENSGN